VIRIEERDFKRLSVSSKGFDRALRASTRKELTAIGKIGSTAVKAKLRSMPAKSGTGRGHGSLRADGAAAIRVSTTISPGRGTQVRIRMANTAALKAHRRFRPLQLMDKGSFRHRVYGTDTWVDQAGFPYFRQTLMANAPAMRAAARVALRDAVAVSVPNVR
jgi:hypothetical protein